MIGSNPSLPGISRLGWFGLLLALAALCLSCVSPAEALRQAWPWYGLWEGLLALPCILLLGRLFSAKSKLHVSASLSLLLVATPLWLTISSFCSRFPALGYSQLSLPLGLVSTLLLVSGFHRSTEPPNDSRESEMLLRFGALASGVLFLASLLGWSGDVLRLAKIESLAQLPRNMHPFGHPVYNAGMIYVCIHLLALSAFRLRGLWLKLALGFILLGLVLLTLSTKSRAGVGSLCLGLCCGGAAWFLSKRKGLRPLLLGAASLALLLVIAVLSDSRLAALLQSGRWDAAAQSSNSERLAMLQAGFRIAADHPVLGAGPGTLPSLYPAAGASLDGAPPTVFELHCTPLQIWAETGLGGLLLLALGVGLILTTGRTLLRSDPARGAVFVSLYSGYALTALLDYQLELPLPTLLLCLPVVLFCPKTAPWSPAIARTAGLLLLIPLAFSLNYQVREGIARHLFATAAVTLEQGGEPAFPELALKAARHSPQSQYYLNQAAAGYWRLYLHTGNAAALEGARQNLEASLHARDDQEYAHFNLGWLLLRDKPAQALGHLDTCVTLAPRKRHLHLGRALALLNLNKPDAAASALAVELLASPASATLTLWDEAALKPLLSAAVERAKVLRASLPDSLRMRREQALLEAWTGQGSLTEFLQLPVTGESSEQWRYLKTAFQPGGGDPNFEDSVRLLTLRYPNFDDFLRAPVRDLPALQVLRQHARRSYNLLARNQDGFPLVDMTLLHERGVLFHYLPTLFPEQGAIGNAHLAALARASIKESSE